MKPREISAILLLAVLWGSSFIFIRIASPAIGPVNTIEGRVTIAGLSLLLFIGLTGGTLDWKKWWKQYLILGTLNAALPFTFIAIAELRLDASMGSILNSLTPLFTVLVAWIWMQERLTIKKWIGVMTGIFGVTILVGWSPFPITSGVLFSMGCSIIATIAYAIAGVYAKKAFNGISPLKLAAGQQIGAAIVLIPFTLVGLPFTTLHVSWTVILSVLTLALLCTAIAYLFYFYLINSVGPTKTLTVTFLVPFFGMIWGIIFLHEEITVGMFIGLIIILGSVMLISDVKFGSKPLNKLPNESSKSA